MQSCYMIQEDIFAVVIADLSKDFIPNGLYVNRINVLPEWRGQGYGKRILDMILEDADSEGVTLYLEPRSYSDVNGLTQAELEAWYLRHGFEWLESVMIRQPRKARV